MRQRLNMVRVEASSAMAFLSEDRYLQKLLTQSDQTWRQATSERKQAHILGNCHHDAMRTRQSAVIGAVCAQKSLHLGVSKAMLNDDSQESRSATCLSSTDDTQPEGLFSPSLAFIWAVDYLLSSPIARTADSTRCGVPTGSDSDKVH